MVSAPHGARPMMEFTSDNCYGVSPEILEAIRAAATGTAASYGDDPATGRLATLFARVFEHEVAVYPVISGTAANALALASIVPSHGAIICHEASHIAVDECGAPEFFSHGAKLATVSGSGGIVSPEIVEAALKRFHRGNVHSAQPAAISVSQSTEFGTVYRPGALRELSAVARKHGLKLHMDGARLANALASLDCSPADATWRSGVDMLSFGATKNGALGAEAVVFFDRNEAVDFEFRRKKSGHLVSKMRFLSAQLEAYLSNESWLKHAARANRLAQLLATGLLSVPDAKIACPVEANAVLVHLPNAIIARLRAAGAHFYDWAPPEDDCTLIRLVTSFATPEESVEKFLEIARR